MQGRAWLVLAALTLGGTLAAEELMVVSEQQCAMFKRVFMYDKHLRDSDKIVVLVVGTSNDGADVAAVAGAFRAQGMYPATVTVASLNADLSATLSPHSTVVYAMPDVEFAAVNEFAADRGFLTVAALPALAESGRVAVSIDMSGSPPQVVVHMPRLTAEGHELSSELLKLARVIR